jgi:hypothetical protein
LPQLPGAERDCQSVTFRFSEKNTQVTGKSPEQETTLEVEGVRVVGNQVTITVNRQFVLKALKLGMTELALIDEFTPLVFTAEGRKLVAMPIRPDETGNNNPTTSTTPVSASAPAENTATTKEEPSNPQEMKTINRIQTAENTAAGNTPAINNTTATTEAEAPSSALKQLVAQVQTIKDNLRDIVGELSDVQKLLAVVQKEKKASEREVEEVREALQSLQKIRI